MWQDTLRRSWGYAAMGTLALLILAGGMCCLDHDGADPSDMDHHVVSMGLCSAIVVSTSGMPVGALSLLGLTASPGRNAFAAVALSVPEPPPRPYLFA
jgi:hypothetical protein